MHTERKKMYTELLLEVTPLYKDIIDNITKYLEYVVQIP
jgi:hypothetical protein